MIRFIAGTQQDRIEYMLVRPGDSYIDYLKLYYRMQPIINTVRARPRHGTAVRSMLIVRLRGTCMQTESPLFGDSSCNVLEIMYDVQQKWCGTIVAGLPHVP